MGLGQLSLLAVSCHPSEEGPGAGLWSLGRYSKPTACHLAKASGGRKGGPTDSSCLDGTVSLWARWEAGSQGALGGIHRPLPRPLPPGQV